jgi:hypothetical protein
MFIHQGTSLPATGQTTSDGSYTLFMKGVGQVLAGSYQVSVSPPASGATVDTSNEDAYAAAMEAGMQGASEAAAPSSPFPEKYQAVETSGVTFEVKEGPNTFNLDMTDE